MAPATRRILLPALCLLLASLCQWLAGPVRSDAGSLGMVAPVPVSWEAIKPAGLPGAAVFDGADPGGIRLRERDSATPAWLLRAATQVTLSDRQERLLWWGRLLLEGG